MWQYYLLGYHFFWRVPFLCVGFYQRELTLLEIIEETGIRMDYYYTKSGLKAWSPKSAFSRSFSLSFLLLQTHFSSSSALSSSSAFSLHFL